ncbi:MAG: hypothetical protein ACREK7_02735 [Gemmatimonadota bacterium]
MSKARRSGLRREPPDGWPLDQVFVGVATLRTLRELFILEGGPGVFSHRAWDVALWSGVTPQGSADALDRLHGVGLVNCYRPERIGEARSFRLNRDYPLAAPLGRLFQAEWAMMRR